MCLSMIISWSLISASVLHLFYVCSIIRYTRRDHRTIWNRHYCHYCPYDNVFVPIIIGTNKWNETDAKQVHLFLITSLSPWIRLIHWHHRMIWKRCKSNVIIVTNKWYGRTQNRRIHNDKDILWNRSKSDSFKGTTNVMTLTKE